MMRKPRNSLTITRPWAHLTAAIAVAGCTSTGDERPPDTMDGDPTVTQVVSIAECREVDWLWVIDNGAQMGPSQAVLAANSAPWFEHPESGRFDIRIGVTTGDVGNAACASEGALDTTPEMGALVLSSCTTRPEQFEWPHDDPSVFAYESACLTSCPQELGDALVFEAAPGTDGPARWLSFGADGSSNVRVSAYDFNQDGSIGPEETDRGVCGYGGEWPSCVAPSQVLACVLPQGIDGCQFQAPLEAQYRALQQAGEPGGLLRPGASLLISQVTDGVDCSSPPSVQPWVFDPVTATREHWEDPEAAVPTQAVCWNAGTACTGSGMPYDGCESANLNYAGETLAVDLPGVGIEELPLDAQPSLYPVDRYVDQLAALAELKAQIGTSSDPDASAPGVWMRAMAGVPQGYQVGATALVYAEPEDPAVAAAHGIDHGCASSSPGVLARTASPPVRLLEVAASRDGDDAPRAPLASVCGDDHGWVMGQTPGGGNLGGTIPSVCVEVCAEDVSPDTPGLQPSCVVTRTTEGVDGPVTEEIPTCDEAPLPNAVGACAEIRTGDALDLVCAVDGLEVEVALQRDPSSMREPCGTRVEVTCAGRPVGDRGCD